VLIRIQDLSSSDTTNKTPEELNLVNPEKLAYILIGVCCGLSILCLIVVAISIGYNKSSETQYRYQFNQYLFPPKTFRPNFHPQFGDKIATKNNRYLFIAIFWTIFF
jgi:hypothetical protein